ncbi:MAG: hypothetical protein SXU28_12755 [Pseudomonadota bacterium]|nr:hypothetical protein [Pseudomonadota bacterium]
MRNLSTALAGLLFSCTSAPSNDADVESTDSKLVEVVFFNFYSSEQVKLTIDEEVAFSGKLEMRPEDEDTGFNLSKEITVPICATYRLTVNGNDTQSDICLDPSDRFVYVNPEFEPLIAASSNDGLD